jgi:hypothetical protein
MKVICQINRPDQLPTTHQKNYQGDLSDWQLPLVLEKRYWVQGIILSEGVVYYYIEDENYSSHGYPVWYPATCFRLEDECVPAGWFFKFFPSKTGLESFVLGFEEWIRQPGFYENLTDGRRVETEIYLKKRQSNQE